MKKVDDLAIRFKKDLHTAIWIKVSDPRTFV